MNKIFNFFVLFLFLSGCSLDTKTSIWTQPEKINSENKNIEKKLFVEKEVYEKEFNKDLKIRLKSNSKKESFIKNYLNNNGVVQFDGKLKKISKYKFSKISQFDQYQPELLFTNKKNLIFFDNKGTILNFGINKKLIWKNNFYSKNEKKQNPILYFDSDDKILIVADNIAKYYAINLINNKLLWSKNSVAPFNSQIKIYKDKFFIIDFSNTLRCFSLKNGNELWSVKTQNSLIRSQKKLSVVLVKDIVYFNNSIGDISAVDLNSGELLWQLPTQNTLIYESSFSLETSDIVTDSKSLYFSNNQNQFFSIDIDSGNFNWETKINSNLRPIIIGNILFTISLEGYLFLIDKNKGSIIRVTDVFDNFKSKKRNLIKPTGFILGRDNIYLSTNNGRLLVIDVANGKTISTLKIDNEKILKPVYFDEKLFVVKNNAIIRLN